MLKAGVLAEPVLVGRERELEELQAFLDLALEGKGKTVFIAGEAGSGKTRLAREFLSSAKKKGVAVMAGWCLSDAAAPYFPFVEAFHSYFASSDEEEQPTSLQQSEISLGIAGTAQMISGERGITAWLTGPTPLQKTQRTEAISPQVWKDQVYAGVAGTLHSMSARQPIILFLEDIHWADSASLALLHYLARAVDNSERIFVLATFRSEELTADAEGHPHPLSEAMRMMRREDLFTEIKLSSLSQNSVSKIAENMIGGSLQPMLAEKLTSKSRGNPLFIVESLRMLHERRSLVQEDNQWRLAVDEFGIPTKIKDIILRRLAILKYAQRRVLDAASVIGEKFDVELLSNVLGLDNLEVLETLNVIAHSTSLVSVEENYYRFDHARSRETLYEELSPPLKRGYHAKIAEKLENTTDGALPLSDLAYHYAQAGNKEKALKYAMAAAKDELARFSNQQAIQHFTYALQNIPDGHAEEKRMALEGLGDAYAANNMYGEAIKTFDELAASETGVVRLRALRKAMDAAFHKGDKPDLLLEYAKKAEELAAYDRLEMARVLNNRGRAFAWAGRGDAKLDLADYNAALQIFEEENSLPDVAEALWRSGIACSVIEDLAEKGLGELLRSVAIFRELGDVRKEIEVTDYMGCGFFSNGLFPEATCEFTKVLRVGEKIGIFFDLASASIFLCMIYERDGKLADALSLALKSLEYCRKTDAVAGTQNAILAGLYSELGDLKRAEECFERIAKLPPEAQMQANFFVAGARGRYLAAKGLGEESNQVFEKLLEDLKNMGFAVNMIMVNIEDYAWALEKQGRFEEAKVQRDRAQKLLEQIEERYKHANVQLSVMAPRKVQVGEDFEMRLDIVNVGRRLSVVAKIGGSVPPEFKVSGLPSFCSLKEGSLEMKEKGIGPFQVETVKLQVNVTKAGSYPLNSEVFYVDDLGTTKTSSANPITITAQPIKPAYEILPGRITTGYRELDRLLLGGIPEKYAVVMAAPSCDERQLLIKHFLEAGVKAGETTLYVTCGTGRVQDLSEQFQSNFYLLICSPESNFMQNPPNIYKLKGIDNLTDVDIALTKLFRTLDPSQVTPKRACIDLISDVLLQHHAIITRKWLSSLLANLKAKDFSTLAVIDPRMHPPEEVQAVLGLFDGEIRIAERESAKGTEKFLKILKLYNQQYSENELVLTKEKLQQ